MTIQCQHSDFRGMSVWQCPNPAKYRYTVPLLRTEKMVCGVHAKWGERRGRAITPLDSAPDKLKAEKVIDGVVP